MSSDAITFLFIVVFVVLGLVSCVSMVQQQQACRERGGEPIVDRLYQVACVKKAFP